MLHMKNEYEMREYKCYLCDFTHEKRNEIIKHTQDVHSKMVFINDESLKVIEILITHIVLANPITNEYWVNFPYHLTNFKPSL